MDDRDIRFSNKKVDESWKDQIEKDRSGAKPSAAEEKTPSQTSPAFLNLLNSLAMQAMMHLGEMPGMAEGQEVNKDAAKEMIDLLVEIKAKAEGNLSAEEKGFFDSVLPQLQMKFVEQV